MDVTNSFESHHIKSDLPEKLLPKFYITEAKKPRSSPYTFNDNDFYQTLKRRVRRILKILPDDCWQISTLYSDFLFLIALTTSSTANAYSSYTVALVASISICLLLIASHNYIHQRDNYRMYYSDIFMFSSRTFRILHILSHHSYPNTTADVDLTFSLPAINVFPEEKNFFVRYLPWLMTTFFFFPLALHIATLLSILESIVYKTNYKCVVLPFLVPFVMYFCEGKSVISTLVMWQIIIFLASFFVSHISFTITHVHPDLYMEGDTIRPNNQLDWGIYQLDTVCDRREIIGNTFLTLTTFGDHALHHLFPTLDHGYLKHLYPILEETMKEFDMHNIHIMTHFDIYLGFFRQAARVVPKLSPPTL
ncbi:hypothetical protein FQA39_LY03060 [Lamprigera yunnana]|nr:hypothetical protein FQA39_LY03060 [Lamprigera yunnana]